MKKFEQLTDITFPKLAFKYYKTVFHQHEDFLLVGVEEDACFY